MKVGLQAQYALLIAGPVGAAILAKAIVVDQVAKGKVDKTPPTGGAQLQDLLNNDDGETDLGDLQYVLFNTVALIFFYGELLIAPQSGLPTVPDVLLGLTSVAAVGYVGKKALAPPDYSRLPISRRKPRQRDNQDLGVELALVG